MENCQFLLLPLVSPGPDVGVVELQWEALDLNIYSEQVLPHRLHQLPAVSAVVHKPDLADTTRIVNLRMKYQLQQHQCSRAKPSLPAGLWP